MAKTRSYRLPANIGKRLDALAKKNKRTPPAELLAAVETHLEANKSHE